MGRETFQDSISSLLGGYPGGLNGAVLRKLVYARRDVKENPKTRGEYDHALSQLTSDGVVSQSRVLPWDKGEPRYYLKTLVSP